MWQWSSELETGFAEVDRQHRELIEQVNHFMREISNGHSEEAVRDTLDFLKTYMVNHFRDEEELQRLYHYPAYAQHKKQHQEFIESFAELEKKAEKEAASLEVVFTLSRTVNEWLVEHIGMADKELADYLKKR